jgi:NAD(P)-dependent dehydrogenase (short-subunit alcohol dehydrogenase family)
VVCPGHTESETVSLPDDHPVSVHVRTYNPSGRMGTPDDFEGIGVYFMSDWSRFHTGDLIVIDGGWMANAGKSDITELPEWP